MSGPSQISLRAELLNRQFYNWEARGRGWIVWGRPVDLEPPFRPFEGHFLPPSFYQDDGVQETPLSQMATRFLTYFGKKPEPVLSVPCYDVEEPLPEYLGELAERVELQVSLPAEYKVEHEVFEQCLLNLSYCRSALAFEVVGTKDELISQVVAEVGDAELVRSQIKGHFPEGVVSPVQTYLLDRWTERSGHTKDILEFGLDQEFMLPLKSVRLMATDPLVGICAALEGLRDGEIAVFQVLFKAARKRWAENILRAVTTDDGEPFFEDAKEILSQAKLKLSSPLFAAVVRVAARSPNESRVGEIIRGLGGVLKIFANPGGNELLPLENDEYPGEPHESDLLNRCSRRGGMLLNSDELVSLAHLPTAAVRSRKLKREIKRTKEAPAVTTGKGIVLGENVHEGNSKLVTLTAEQRTRHMHVIGASGTGKSTFLLNLIDQDIQNGDGVAVLDPHGDLVEAVLRRVPPARFGDVVLFDPSDQEYPVGFNILSAHSELERSLLEGDLVATFQRLSTSWGDQMTAVLGNAIMALLESPQGGTLGDLRRFLIEDDFRRQYLKEIHDAEILYYWKRQFPLLAGKPQASVVTRLDRFLRPRSIRHMVCQKESRLDFGEMMNRGKIFLAKLPQGLIGEENSYLLGTLLVAKFHQMAIGRQSVEVQKRRDFWLYVDEFHNFITPSMASILSGARKYRLGLVLAHQDFGQLKHRDAEVGSAVMTNPYTRVCFRLGDEDARKLAEGFSCFEAEDFENLGIGEAICRVERREFDFNLRVTPMPDVSKESADTARAEIGRLSREAYATPKEKVAEELAKLWTFAAEDEEPRGCFKQRPMGTHASPASTQAPVAPGAPPPVPTAAQEPPPLPIPKPPPSPGRGGPEHKRIVEFIRLVAESLKWSFEREAKMPGGSADLLLKKDERCVGIQVSVSNHVPAEVEGLKKCLAARFTQVVMVCSKDNPEKLERIQEASKKILSEAELQKVTWLLEDDVLKFLKGVGGDKGASTLIAGRTVTVKQTGTLEDAANASQQINKISAKAMSKRKKRGQGGAN